MVLFRIIECVETRRVLAATFVVAVLVAIACRSPAFAAELGQEPSAKAFDSERNPINRMIRIGGFACEHIPNTPKACRIEIDLANYIKALPANRDDIGRELAALGAVCAHDGAALRCVYERKFDRIYWIPGAPRPVTEHLRFDIGVVGKDDSLAVDVRFNRTTTDRDQKPPK